MWSFRTEIASVTLCLLLLAAEIRQPVDAYDGSDVVNKSSTEIIRMRGFEVKVHYARTRDGYHLHLSRLINPLGSRGKRLKRPVLFVHGFLESSTVWVLNSRFSKPRAIEGGHLCFKVTYDELLTGTSIDLSNGPMLLANQGYDVWLLSLRGTEWSQKHDRLDVESANFWDYSMDEFGLSDLPTAIDYIQTSTGARKIGYVGHSHATFPIFALLSTRPSYSKLIEPVILLSPTSLFKPTGLHLRAALRTANKPANDVNERSPFPLNAFKLRNMTSKVCARRSSYSAEDRLICEFLEELAIGAYRNSTQGYASHVPMQSSFKVLRHLGQLMSSRRFAKYDHGPAGNLRRYGQAQAPDYPIEKISSKSISLFYAYKDLEDARREARHFVGRLKVRPFSEHFVAANLDHFHLLVSDRAGKLIYAPVLRIFELFEHRSGVCSVTLAAKLKANVTTAARPGRRSIGASREDAQAKVSRARRDLLAAQADDRFGDI